MNTTPTTLKPVPLMFRVFVAIGGIFIASGLPTGCATPKPAAEAIVPVIPVRTHYVQRIREVVRLQNPLPTRTDVDLEWHYSDGSIEVVPGFRLWDMNGDGTPDRVEVLSETGEITGVASDYTFDGIADGWQAKGESEVSTKPFSKVSLAPAVEAVAKPVRIELPQ